MSGSPSRFSPVGQRRPSGTRAGSTPRRIAAASCGVFIVAAAVLTQASVAGAAPRPVFWVSSGGASARADSNCRTAPYSTVQSAVAGAEAYESQHRGEVPTVEICPGTYTEQVTILKSLVLTRAPVPQYLGPVTIELPASVGADQSTGLSSTNCQAEDGADQVQTPQSVIEVCAAGAGGANTTGTAVTVSDLTVAGNWPGSACYDSLYDILVEGGATLSLTGSTVEKAGAVSPLSGCQGGLGIQAGNSTTGQIGHADLTRDTIKTYQKGGISVKGSGSSAAIDDVTVTGAGPTAATAQNGIEFVYGATGSVTDSTVSGNNYTGANGASAAGILTFGGCGSALVKGTRFTANRLIENDMGIALANYNAACSEATTTPSNDLACDNIIENSHGYPGGTASADANVSGDGTSPEVGYQAGIYEVGNGDVICDNVISGAGYAPLGATSSLPNPPPPAFVRLIDTVSGPAIAPQVYRNTYDGRPYNPA